MVEICDKRERRGCSRVPLRALARLIGEGPVAACPVRNVSLTGALLESPAPRRPGERVVVMLRLERRGQVAASGRIVWCGRRRGGRYPVALRFEKLTPAAILALGLVIERRLARQVRARRGLVMVIDSATARRSTLSRRLASLGYPSVRIACPVEALWWLAAAGGLIHTVIVGEPAGSASAEELAGHLGVEFPDVHVLVLASAVRGESVWAGELEVVDEPLTRERLDEALRETWLQ